jgi:hypothetical protein
MHQKTTGKENDMKSRTITTIIAPWTQLVLLASFVILALSLSWGVTSVLASDGKSGSLHATKDCAEYTGLSGDHCTIASSDLAEIPVGSIVYYDQAAGIPTGLLDSNVVLDAGNGDRAVGRCTLDFSTALGLCTFSNGTGRLGGFTAEVKVSCPDGPTCTLDGTYRFSRPGAY